MPALVAGIHVFGAISKKGVDARPKAGHDEISAIRKTGLYSTVATSPGSNT
jgi:hypothetical protein